MYRPAGDEDERPGQRADLPLTDEEEEPSLEYVEQLVAGVVDVAGRSPVRSSPPGTRSSLWFPRLSLSVLWIPFPEWFGLRLA